MNIGSEKGVFCISLDFELMWGVQDTLGEQYSSNIYQVHSIVPKLLDLFEEFNVVATWATVGFILLGKNNFRDYLDFLEVPPKYSNKELANISKHSHVLECNQDLYFAPQLVQTIKAKGHELASHTSSHMYYLDAVNGVEALESDLKLGKSIFGEHKCNSLIFPRNQYDLDAVNILNRFGFTCFRSNPDHWAYTSSSGIDNSYFKRLYRLVDTYVNLSGYHTYKASSISTISGCKAIPASMFLRPVTQSRLANRLQLIRIKKAMLNAAKFGKVFHLWWHPHNFGSHTDENFIFLKEILIYFEYLNGKYAFTIKTMDSI